MSKFFAPNAVRRSHGLEGTKRPLIQLLLLFNRHKRYHLQIQTHSEIPRFAVCNENCTTQRRVACTKSLENLTFSDENSDSGENDGQLEGDNVDFDPTLEANCSSSEPHLLTQGYLNELHYDFNLSKEQAKFLD
jgi:hypothetical protein